MTVNLQGVVQQPGQGSSYWVLGDLYTFKAVGEDTGKAYALVEIIVQPQNGTPPHIHSHEDEAFYIQEGELEFQLDEQIVVATPGTFLHSPKGQLHRFTNVGTQPAAEITHSPTVTPADIEKVLTAAPRYGLEIIPPPPDAQ
jgi:quercetin dioxygenase-like cupin family protein